jgi:hypothetical protein
MCHRLRKIIHQLVEGVERAMSTGGDVVRCRGRHITPLQERPQEIAEVVRTSNGRHHDKSGNDPNATLRRLV